MFEVRPLSVRTAVDDGFHFHLGEMSGLWRDYLNWEIDQRLEVDPITCSIYSKVPAYQKCEEKVLQKEFLVKKKPLAVLRLSSQKALVSQLSKTLVITR